MMEREISVCVLPADPSRACLGPGDLPSRFSELCLIENKVTAKTHAIFWLPNLAAGNVAAELRLVLLEALRLKAPVSLIHLPMTGVDDYIDLMKEFEESLNHPRWCCAKGCYARPVAEHALALALALLRNLTRPTNGSKLLTRSLTDDATTVFIIGRGSVSNDLEELMMAFDCRRYTSCSTSSPCEVDRALAGADVVFVCCPLTEATRNSITSATFCKMKPNAVLINIARGEIVDTVHLLDALEDNTIAAAGLDVITLPDMKTVRRVQSLQTAGKLIVTDHAAVPIECVKPSLLKRLTYNLEILIQYQQNIVCAPFQGEVIVGKGY